MDHTQVLIRPVVSEKSYVLAAADKYAFRVHPDAHKTQIRQAVEALFDVKVNRKARRAAFRGALTAHAAAGTLGVLADDAMAEPSTQLAASLLAAWGKDRPAVVVALPEQEAVVKSFRNLDRVVMTSPAELEVAAVVWARALLVTEAALPLVQGRAA